MQPLAQIISSEIEEMFKGTSLHLMDVKCSFSQRFTQIRIIIDREDCFIKHGDCVEYSNKIKDIIDAKELISNNYRLEVSSPGIGRPLKEPWEFRKNMEKKLSVRYQREDGEEVSFSGILVDTDDAGISIKTNNGIQKIAWKDLLNACSEPPW